MNAICWWQVAATNCRQRTVAQRRFDLARAGLGVAEHRDREAVQAARLGTDAPSSESRTRARVRRSLGSACAGSPTVTWYDACARRIAACCSGLPGVLVRQQRLAARQHRVDRLRLVGRTGVREHELEEVDHRVAAIEQRQGPIALVARLVRLPERPGEPGADRRRPASAPAPTLTRLRRVNLAARYPKHVGAGAHRLVGEVAAKVLGERIDGRVALGRALLQRLGDDIVQVAAQQPLQLFRRHRASRSVLRKGLRRQGSRRGDRLGKARRRRVDDRLHQLDGRTRGATRRMLPAEQHVEQHAERVHVGGGGHRLAEELLGRGVFRRQGATAFPREFGRLRRRRSLLEQLGDAEVEQLDAAVFRHQHVVRLDVAMDDEVGRAPPPQGHRGRAAPATRRRASRTDPPT